MWLQVWVQNILYNREKYEAARLSLPPSLTHSLPFRFEVGAMNVQPLVGFPLCFEF